MLDLFLDIEDIFDFINNTYICRIMVSAEVRSYLWITRSWENQCKLMLLEIIEDFIIVCLPTSIISWSPHISIMTWDNGVRTYRL